MLAAGAINSPQLLQLFGIGNSALLGHFGIPVVLESPGIGENLVDQYAVRMAARVRGMRTLNERAHGPAQVAEVLKYAFAQRGMSRACALSTHPPR